MSALKAFSVAIALVAPGLAFAQGAGDWTGPSIGAEVGYLDFDSSDGDLDGSGATLGLRANYDYDFGTYVIGGGIEWDSPDTDLGDGASLDEVLRLRARAGIDAGQNWYYGTVGWTRASVDDPGGDVGDSDGYFFGLGYEVYVNPNITAGAEILRHEYDSFDLEDFDASATTLNLSVNFRF